MAGPRVLPGLDPEKTHRAHQFLGAWESQTHFFLRRKASTSSLLQSQAVC